MAFDLELVLTREAQENTAQFAQLLAGSRLQGSPVRIEVHSRQGRDQTACYLAGLHDRGDRRIQTGLTFGGCVLRLGPEVGLPLSLGSSLLRRPGRIVERGLLGGGLLLPLKLGSLPL